MVVGRPLFSSATSCGTDIYDFADGYPCTLGYQDYVADDFDRTRLDGTVGMYTELFDALGIDRDPPTGDQVLFFLISGIYHTQGIRLGCGCVVPACITDQTSQNQLILDCSTDRYLNDDGFYDFNADQFEYDQSILFDETYGAKSMFLNGQIPSLFELCIQTDTSGAFYCPIVPLVPN
jgi:hypothetical protein